MPFIDYEELPANQRCTSPEHDPPGMIVLQPGRHTYQCPTCGKTVTFTVSQKMCNDGEGMFRPGEPGEPWVSPSPSPPWKSPHKEWDNVFDYDWRQRDWNSNSPTSCDTYGEPDFPTPRPTQSQCSYWYSVE